MDIIEEAKITIKPDELEIMLKLYLEERGYFLKKVSWEHGQRLTGHGQMESMEKYFDGVIITAKKTK